MPKVIDTVCFIQSTQDNEDEFVKTPLLLIKEELLILYLNFTIKSILSNSINQSNLLIVDLKKTTVSA